MVTKIVLSADEVLIFLLLALDVMGLNCYTEVWIKNTRAACLWLHGAQTTLTIHP